MARIVLAGVAVVCLGLVFASAAVASTVTIGAPDVSSTQGLEECPDTACARTLVQLIQPTSGVLLTAPADGVITAWHVHGNTAQGRNGSLALRVLRRDPDGVRFTGVATSAGVTAFFSDGSPAHVVSIPVKAGDYIGVDMSAANCPEPCGSPVWVYYAQPSGVTYGVWEGGLSDGSTMASSSTVGGRLMLNAVESLRPAVSGVSPSLGSTAGGGVVTISGSDLDGATAVSFGGVPAAAFTVVSPTQITATPPARSQGTIHVQVTGPGGMSPVASADAYSYVATPPSIALGLPANGATYKQGEAITSAYSCIPPAGVTVTSCTGPVANGAPIDTATLGSHTFTVNAQDSDGGAATQSANYTVALAPSIAIVSPPSGAMYARGQAVAAVYSCSAPAPAGVTACAGPVANGARIDTSTLGSHTFTVNARDTDGVTATKTTGYTVLAAATPIVSGAGQTAGTWRENDTLPHIAAKNKLPVGTTFSFSLNERATVRFRFTQQLAGRKVHGKCVALSATNRRKPRCTRTINAGTLTFTGHPGAAKVRFAGRISRSNKLTPGHYTLQITATNTQRKRSRPQSLTFTIVK
jgi:hypothetical protein